MSSNTIEKEDEEIDLSNIPIIPIRTKLIIKVNKMHYFNYFDENNK